MSGGYLSLDDSAHRCGGHCWTERRLFTMLGAAVVGAEDPAVALVLDRLSQHAAWRAQQWWDRLPLLADVEREDLVVAPSAGPEVAGPGREVLGLAARVLLPRRAVAYARHLDAARAPADASVRRTLQVVASDVAADWVDASRVLEDLDSAAAALP